MPREPSTTEAVTATQIAILCGELEQFLEVLRKCEAVAKSQPSETMGIYNWKSAQEGLIRLSSFIESADKSRRAAVMGNPIAVGALKPRSVAKMRSVEEVKKELDTVAAKATGKKKIQKGK